MSAKRPRAPTAAAPAASAKPSKRPAAAPTVERSSKKAKTAPAPTSAPVASTSTAPRPSLLSAPPAEPDFPRGHVAAPKASSSTKKSAAVDGGDVGDLFTVGGAADAETAAAAPSAKRRKLDGGRERDGKREAKGKKGADKPPAPKPVEGIRVEHLSYKKLIVGTRVLVQVVSIRDLELVVALPNQLLGHVPIIAVSSYLTKRLEDAAEDSESSDEEDESSVDDPDAVPTLGDLFKPGQLLRAVVTSLRSADAARKTVPSRSDDELIAARRVELSVDPAKVNETAVKTDLVPGYVLSAAVKSVEDNGYVLDLGVGSVSAFVSFADAQTAFDERRLHGGQIVSCKIVKLAGNGRTCTVSLKPADISSSLLTHAPAAGGMLPGLLINALVTAVVPSGLNVKLLGFFDGTIDLYHLGPAGTKPASAFTIGQKVKARVLWQLPTPDGLSYALSLLPHIVRPPADPSEAVVNRVGRSTPVGTIIEGVKVERVDREWGLIVSLGEEADSGTGFVHISRVADDRIDQLSTSSGPWAVGMIHRARVVGHSALDGLVQLSLQPSVLDKLFLDVRDVQVGDRVRGTVRNLRDSGLFVEIQGSVDGVVWPLHYSDVKLKHPERKFKPGAAVNARIFAVDAEKQRISLTLKKSLVGSKLPVCTSFADAQVGKQLDGVVSKVMEKGLLVDLFGGLRALVPIAEAADGYVKNLAELFTVGQSTVVRLIAVNSTTQQLTARIRQTEQPSVAAVDVGVAYEAVVSALHASTVSVKLEPSGVVGLVTHDRLARARQTTADALKASLQVGDRLGPLVVTSRDESKSIVMVSPLSLSQPSSSISGVNAGTDISFDTLDVGPRVPVAKVVGSTPQGLLVQIGRSLRGRAAWTDVADDYDAPRPGMGEGVHAVVVALDADHRRIDLSLRPSVVDASSSGKPRDPLIEAASDVKIGQRVRGFVSNIADAGLFVLLGRGVTARVQIRDLFDEFVKDWKPRFSIGQVVEGTVTSVDVAKGQVSMRLRSGVDAKAAPAGPAFGDLAQGQIVSGVIKSVQKYGIFIRVADSAVSGLCHRSELPDGGEGDDWASAFVEGQKVRAYVLSLDPAKRKIAFSLKPSLVPAEDDEDGGEDEVAPSGTNSVMQDLMDLIDRQVTSADVSASDDDEDDDLDVVIDTPTSVSAPDTPRAAVQPTRMKAKPTSALQVSAGFDFAGAAPTLPVADSESEDESESDDAAADETEMDVDRTATLDSSEPTSTTDFDRLVLGEPNSSELWIRYMSHHLSTSDVAAARAVGQRALQTIHFREEDERLNVWIALLNLETAYGSAEVIERTLTDAIAHNDAKTVYARAAEVFTAAARFDRADDVHQRFVRKFGQSSKAWTLYGQFLLDRGRTVDARELLARSLKSLPKRKHVKTIAKFAQMEFRHGDPERGRTIFEGILDSHPKRVDLWYVYIDLETRLQNLAAVRALYDRLLRRMTKPTKVKAALKRWLAFEKKHGDQAHVDAVIKRAKDYVAGSQGALAPTVAAAPADDADSASEDE